MREGSVEKGMKVVIIKNEALEVWKNKNILLTILLPDQMPIFEAWS
jgi:hypothetical protein